MTNSDAQISKYGAISEHSNGISYLKNLKDLKLSDGNINVEKLIESFANLKKKIVTKPITEVLVSSGEIPDTDNDEYFPKEKNLFELKNVNLNTDETAWITESLDALTWKFLYDALYILSPSVWDPAMYADPSHLINALSSFCSDTPVN